MAVEWGVAEDRRRAAGGAEQARNCCPRQQLARRCRRILALTCGLERRGVRADALALLPRLQSITQNPSVSINCG